MPVMGGPVAGWVPLAGLVDKLRGFHGWDFGDTGNSIRA